jgi:hypothetical protein
MNFAQDLHTQANFYINCTLKRKHCHSAAHCYIVKHSRLKIMLIYRMITNDVSDYIKLLVKKEQPYKT